MSVDPLPKLGIPFHAEKELQDFLIEHWRILTPFKTWFSLHVGSRLDLPGGGSVTPDLIGNHRRGITAIELKLHRPQHDAVSQIQRAVEALEVVNAAKGPSFKVAGMVITNDRDFYQEQDLEEWGLRTHHEVSWLRYMLRLDLEDVLVEPPEPE